MEVSSSLLRVWICPFSQDARAVDRHDETCRVQDMYRPEPAPYTPLPHSKAQTLRCHRAECMHGCAGISTKSSALGAKAKTHPVCQPCKLHHATTEIARDTHN